MVLRRLGKKLQYHLNDLLVRNPLWQLFVLVVFSTCVIILGMILVKSHLRCEQGETTFWWSLTRLMDQGTFVDDHTDDAHTRAVAVFITLSGVLVMSTLIGTFSSKISERLESLKKGRSPIVEKDHLIVCGNGDRLYEVTRELIEARRDEPKLKRSSIVMISETSREEMEEVLSQRTGRRSVREVICRTGTVTDIDSLRIAGFESCRGFVIIGEEDNIVLKTLIAVSSLCGSNRPVSVCEIRNARMGEIALMAHPDVNWVPVREVVMRLVIQICRQPGLSAVYKEILSFTGNEFYFRSIPNTAGMTFSEVAARMSRGVAVGIEHRGKVNINPEPGTRIGDEDRLLVMAEGPDLIHLSGSVPEISVQFRDREPCGHLFRMLVLSGHSTRFSLMLGLLDRYSTEGARIVVAGSLPPEEGRKVTETIQCPNSRIEYLQIDRTDPDALRDLHPEDYDSIMVVSGKVPGVSDEKADSESMVTLLILKNIRKTLGDRWNATVVAEIRNPRNRKLASAAEIDDFVISNEVCSMIMAQLVKQRELAGVFEEIFDPSGCEMHLRCASQYFPGTFRELEAQGRLRREVVLGWLTGCGSEARVTLNPPRETRMPDDEDCRIIAIAER